MGDNLNTEIKRLEELIHLKETKKSMSIEEGSEYGSLIYRLAPRLVERVRELEKMLEDSAQSQGYRSAEEFEEEVFPKFYKKRRPWLKKEALNDH